MFSQWTKSIENFLILYNNGESFLPFPLTPMLTIYKLEPGEMYTILAKIGNIIVPSYLHFIHLYETPSLIFSLVYSKKSSMFLKPEPFSSEHFPGHKGMAMPHRFWLKFTIRQILSTKIIQKLISESFFFFFWYKTWIVPIFKWACHQIPCQFGALFCYFASQIYTTLLTCHAKADKFPISPDFMAVSF